MAISHGGCMSGYATSWNTTVWRGGAGDDNSGDLLPLGLQLCGFLEPLVGHCEQRMLA